MIKVYCNVNNIDNQQYVISKKQKKEHKKKANSKHMQKKQPCFFFKMKRLQKAVPESKMLKQRNGQQLVSEIY